MSAPARPDFATLVQEFFRHRLMAEKGVSSATIASYSDAFRLLLAFAERKLHRPPAKMELADLDAPLVHSFLDHLEHERGNTARTRNLRLTAIRSFMTFASRRDPSSLAVAQRVLAIPNKRFDRPSVGFLAEDEIEALLSAPDPATWSGRRDRVLFATMYNTGARVTEIANVRRRDLALARPASVLLHGKGRKERCVPLWPKTAATIRGWLTELPDTPEQAVFPNRTGRAMSRAGVEARLDLAVGTAAGKCPTLAGRRVSPHTLRHTTAMHLLQSGVDITVIALWLGHESPDTTHLYVEADLKMKEKALARLTPPGQRQARYKPGDKLLAFLTSL